VNEKASFPPSHADAKVLSYSHHQKVLKSLFPGNSIVMLTTHKGDVKVGAVSYNVTLNKL